MAGAELEIVRAAVTAFNARDLDALGALIGEDAEFTSRLAGLDGTTYRGPEGIRRYIADIESAFAGWHTAGNELIEAPDGRVLHLSTIVARGRGGGVPIEQPTAILYTVRDGLIRHADVFFDRAQARAAAGLPS